MVRTLWMASALLGACGGRQAPAGSRSTTAADAARPDAAPGAGGEPAMTAGPTPAECEALVDHVLVVGITKQRSQVAPELVPTAAQVAAIRAELVVEMVPACVAYPRPVFACAMAAVTTDAVVACSLDAP